jgi:DNA-binding beta-propeller fold protein YncE
MRRGAVVSALVAVIVVAAAQAAYGHGASVRQSSKSDFAAGVVFVQTNQLTANRIVVYDRAANGLLSPAGVYRTGGKGGAAVGAVSDKLASQGSLAYDAAHSLLFAVNAGSNTISMFQVTGDTLTRRAVVPSGGDFPASITVHGNLVYVLNAGGTGIVQGFWIAAAGGRLIPLRGSARELGLANTVPPNFLTSPGQVGFTPDGQKLIVTTKASTSQILVFTVEPNGRLSGPTVNASATPTPFAFTFDPAGRLVSGEAGISALTTYTIGSGGTLTGAQSLTDNQMALCWVQRVGPYYYVANTGSNTVSGYQLDGDGTPSLITADGIVATTEPGPIDLTASSEGNFLFGETGATGTVDEYHVKPDGTLTKLGAITNLPPGIEGIAAT